MELTAKLIEEIQQCALDHAPEMGLGMVVVQRKFKIETLVDTKVWYSPLKNLEKVIVQRQDDQEADPEFDRSLLPDFSHPHFSQGIPVLMVNLMINAAGRISNLGVSIASLKPSSLS